MTGRARTADPDGRWLSAPIAAFLAALCLAGCAASTPPPPMSTDPAVIARCRDLLYIARAPRGPPNWTLYDNCLRGLPETW
jgi:hypothetical protein